MGRRNPTNSPTALAPPVDPTSDRSRWINLLAIAALALAALCVYSNSFSAPFVFDDGTWIEGNKSIQHLWPISGVLSPPNASTVGGRPVVSLTLALNYALGGKNVWGYHAVNLLIHILAAWTLFDLVRRTLLLPAMSQMQSLAAAATPLAFAAALIWAVHPLQTAAVTYIIQRTESLVALFYLLTIYCVLRGATSCGAGRAVVCCGCRGVPMRNGDEGGHGDRAACRAVIRSDISRRIIRRGVCPALETLSGAGRELGRDCLGAVGDPIPRRDHRFRRRRI